MREKLTVVLFKDHLTSRTLKLPLQWLPRLGLLWLTAMFLTLVAAGLLVRAYFHGSGGSSTFAVMRAEQKNEELEKQLTELRTSYDALQSRTQGGTSTGTAPTAAPGNTNFTALPISSTRSSLPARESLPFRLESLKAQWRGNMLQLTTAIEYIRDDGGNQQGHFVIIARGPQNIFTYPDGALTPAGSDTLIRPESGEYFSVSRYREVKASFGPVQNRDAIRSIEFFVFGPQKDLIFYDRAGVEAPKTKPVQKPTEEATEAPAPAAAAPSTPAAENPAQPAAQAPTATPAGNAGTPAPEQ